MANPQADLAALSVRRESGPAEIRPPRRWISRVVVPAALVGGFVSLFLWSSWESLWPATPVTVTTVRFQDGPSEPTGGELFKASGWVEPRPAAVDVAVQTHGMYRAEEVPVKAGDRVAPGQLLVRLDDTKAKLDLEAARKRLEKRRAIMNAVLADQAKAEVAVKNAQAAIDLAKQEGQAEVLAAEAEKTKAEANLKTADLAVSIEERLKNTGVSTSDVKLQQARLARDVAQADIRAATAKIEKANILAAVKVRQMELARTSAEAELGGFKARVAEAEAEIGEAAVAVGQAQLELDRTRIVAPCAGVIMQLNVRVGTIMGGQAGTSEHRDVAVTLYDPAKLQVRVEVPVAKFGLVRNGQPAIVELDDILPGVKLTGTVLADTHQANIARNSVPVKVALPDSPAAVLRPDMIAAVRFIAPKAESTAPTAATRRMLVPRKLVRWDADQAKVWIVDHRQRAEVRIVEAPIGSKDQASEWLEVRGGLQPTDRLITSPTEGLKPGQRVQANEGGA
jgi:HlyD family secretion protein